MKKWFAIMLGLLMFLCVCAAAEMPENTIFSSDYAYIILDDGTAEIVTYLNLEEEYVDVVIPSTLDGIPVTQIGANAFSNCAARTITIPEGIRHIGNSAFSYCSYIKEFIIPSTVESMDSYAFYMNLNLTSVTISDGVKALGDHAFDSCYWLQSVDIPASVESVGVNPFGSCRDLVAINVAPENPVLESIDGVLFNKVEKQLISYPQALVTEHYIVPEGTAVIATEAFFDCSGITSITFPESLRTIEREAIPFCDELVEITLPEGVETIGEAAFALCSNLKSAHLPASITTMDTYIFEACSEELTITAPAGSCAAEYAAANGIPCTNP